MIRTTRVTVAVLAAVAFATPTWGQDIRPRVAQAAEKPTPEAPALLERPARLQIENATLEAALKALTKSSGVPLAFSPTRLPENVRVRCECEDIGLREALDRLLAGTSLSYMELAGQVVLYPVDPKLQRGTLVDPQSIGRFASRINTPLPGHARSGDRSPNRTRGTGVLRRAQNGAIVGSVTEASTGDPVVNVQISLDGAGRTLTNEQGSFRIGGVAPGRHTVGVSSIGYESSSREVDVADGATVVVNFQLEVSPTRLAEIVATATGQQRLVELGHVVGRIDADSLTQHAPVISISDLLMARVPGVLVQQHDGQVGGGNRVRIRGQSTVYGGAEPIVIVDGVRYEGFRQIPHPNWTTGDYEQGTFRVSAPSRLNDLNIHDIEEIEVVKGPSAATLYGPDAANGVILITTKRGRAGPARWQVYSEAASTDVGLSRHTDDVWWGWSTSASGSPNTFSCSLARQADGVCVQDSIARIPNPMNDSDLSFYKPRPRWNYGASVSGGAEDVRYFLSADQEDATGPVHMPAGSQDALKEVLGVDALPEEYLDPNHVTRTNLRGNLGASVGDRLDLQVNSSYTQSATRTMSVLSTPWQEGFLGNPATGSTWQGTYANPAHFFASTSTEHLKRWTVSASGAWRPIDWLMGRVSAGLDVANTNRLSMVPPGVFHTSIWNVGGVADERNQTTVQTLSLDATATARKGRFGFRTTLGGQYHHYLAAGLRAEKRDLLPVGSSFAQAQTIRMLEQDHLEQASLGTFLEQHVSLNDRVYLTGGLRFDQASTFGRDVDISIHPKVNASWLISEEPFFPGIPYLDELRLRSAFGSSLIQPRVMATTATFRIVNRFVEGADRAVADQFTVANPDLRPERVREYELGLDLSALQQRFDVELTYYRSETRDAFTVLEAFPYSLQGIGNSLWSNVGLITKEGYEALVSTSIVDTRALRINAVYSHSFNDTRLAKAGDVGNAGGREGHPIGGLFLPTIEGVADTVGGGPDGVAVRDEVIYGDTAFIGRTLPPRSQQLVTTVGVLDNSVRLSALIDRTSGHLVQSAATRRMCLSHQCRAQVDPSSSLEEQAAVLEYFRAGWEPGDITRLREVSLGVDVPSRLLAFGIKQATLTLQGRNLAVLSQAGVDGEDPESARGGLFGGFVQNSTSAIPQSRTWIVRLDIGF